MICTENVVVGLDGEIHVPVNFREPVTSIKSKIQSNAFIELGKKLLQSAREGDIDGVHDLMSKGAPFSTDWLGFSPLHLAVINNHVDLCDVLLRAGIGKDGRTKVDRTPLHFAAYHGHVEILKVLLYSGAEVDCKDMLKMTPLHWAVEKGHEECACLLLNFGADPRAESKFYRTPLSIAMEMEWTEMIELLQISTNIEATKSIVDSVQDVDMNENEEPVPVHKIKKKIDNRVKDIDNENVSAEKEDTLPQMDVTNPATVQLLREHGIAMIPADNTNTVTSAFQSGRQIVLSDAGKLVLRECKVQNEASKHINISKRPLILPRSKLKETKLYTVSSSQFLAMTKPMDSVKKTINTGNNINIVQLPKKNINAKTQPLIAGKILVKKLSGNVVSKGEVFPMKPKIVQLKSGTNLNNVKIILNNQNIGKIINSNVKIPISNQSGAETKNDVLNSINQQNEKLSKELLNTKSELTSAKLQIENYKKRILELETELDLYKNKLSSNSLIDLENNTISLS